MKRDRIKSPQKQNLSPSKFQDDLIKSLIDNSLKVIDKKIFFSENNTSKR